MAIQDSFISDEEEDLCPLCIEELDLSDRNFKPCPCGYQICQFCYNNIRQNPELNGRCPACRRLYDDESVEYKPVSAEEIKNEQARQARKERERKQREREQLKEQLKERDRKDDTHVQPRSHSVVQEMKDSSIKKHLAGMRVIQKNLVYVIGLNPQGPTDDLPQLLRGEQFFGQYGKIQKIIVNRRTKTNGAPGIGVYVTFARKEDAAKCIAAVDGSVNSEGRTLRAAYGTTKYCSSYLRGQHCQNPQCMFLHEPGEDTDSYTRGDLSAMQHRHTQPTSVGTQAAAPVATPVVTGQPGSAAAAVPSTPPSSAWGKAPASVQRLPEYAGHDLTILNILNESLASLNKPVELHVHSDAPSLVSVVMSEDMRLSIYGTAMNELEMLSPKMTPSPPTGSVVDGNVTEQQSTILSRSNSVPDSASPSASSPAPVVQPFLSAQPSAAQNSQELLAHLYKGTPSQSAY